jgi:peptidoglycan/xylan/chitin deacetylase (PgdA/CDA1 family)
MYHYVRDLKSSKYPRIKGLDYSDFVNQINFLKRRYRILSMEEFINNDFDKTKKNCLLTFDDGYIDHYDFVFPTLIDKSIKGSFFTPVDTINDNKLLDVNLIHLILASSEESKILDRLMYHYGKMELEIPIDNYIQSINTFSRYDTETTIMIKRLLQTVLPFEIRTNICRYLLIDFLGESEKDLSKSFYLSKKNIREMISEGMHFGSHGKSHYWFSSLKKTEQEVEIKSSIEFLSSLYSDDFDLTMCYPYGDYNNETLDLLKKYNFQVAVTTKPRTFQPERDNLLEIPRWDTNDYYPIKN